VSYDIGAARAAGLSDRQIIDYLSKDRDYDAEGAFQAGVPDSQIAEYMSRMEPESSVIEKLASSLPSTLSTNTPPAVLEASIS